MTSEIMAIGQWRTNADMIADAVVPLGYLHEDWVTLDPTYGYGKWWTRWKPRELVGSDLDPSKSPIGISVDFTVRRRSAPPLEGIVGPDGQIVFAGTRYSTPTGAAKEALDVGSVDGWLRWRVPRLQGKSLADLRTEVSV